MKQVYELDEADIHEAIEFWLKNIQGAKGSIEVFLANNPGCSDQRDYQAPYITARAVTS